MFQHADPYQGLKHTYLTSSLKYELLHHTGKETFSDFKDSERQNKAMKGEVKHEASRSATVRSSESRTPSYYTTTY